jgi:ATP-dependent Clp protease ATP-binding subunit ClpB
MTHTAPRWLEELSLSMASNPQVIVTGNVRDYHLVLPPDCPGADRYDTIRAVGHTLFERGVTGVFIYNPISGLTLATKPGVEPSAVVADMEKVERLDLNRLISGAIPANEVQAPLGSLMDQVVWSFKRRLAMVMDYAGWLAPATGGSQTGGDHSTEAPGALRRATVLASSASAVDIDGTGLRYNPIIWIVRQTADLPTHLTSAPGVRIISIERPSWDARRTFGLMTLRSWPKFREFCGGVLDESNPKCRTALNVFASATEGFTLREAKDIHQLAVDQNLEVDQYAKAPFAYRVGVTVSEWEKPAMRERIRGARALEGIRAANFVGQDAAANQAAEIIQRAAIGLAGAEASANPNRPKGVLFFAGPTGVGKTMLAKAIAKLVFGRADAYSRFDMSEYSMEHTEARLIGAPPGYVGYGEPGQLTDAVRQRPFSLLLFDEVEKAHPRILDKFLQILDEGRLTDGSGTTVNFSETIVVFTSNLGIRRVWRNPRTGQMESAAAVTYEQRHPRQGGAAMAPSDYEALVKAGVREYFEAQLGRPELLNRIGDANVIVFDYMSRADGEGVLHHAVKSVERVMLEKHGVNLQLSERGWARLIEQANGRLEMGGRGMNSAVEQMIVNPLSRYLAGLIDSDGNLPSGTVIIDGLTFDDELNRFTIQVA